MKKSVFIWGALLGIFLASAPLGLYGQTAEELETQIASHNTKIDQLEKEIEQYQKELQAVSGKKQTLQNTITQLNLQIKKTQANITVLKTQIERTQLQIQQLSKNISGKQSDIERDKAGLAESLRQLDALENRSIVVAMLASANISDSWKEAEQNIMLQGAVAESIEKLSHEKQQLTDTKTEVEKKKAELLKQQNALVAQQGSLNAQKKAQNDLLAQTKSQESNFQAILAEKRAAKANFEQALLDLNDKLKYVVDPSSITPAGKGVLRWPLDSVRITQQFGDTSFSRSGAYNGKGHNGIDLAAPIGTPIKSSLTGTVIGTGNTDAVKGCYSFGKWVMVQHNNGLNTMYAHLSTVSVSTGQLVGTGEVLGYSGETGYATGPHLHFGVYVSSATQIIKLGSATKSKTPCANATMPVTPLTGYLDPMNYL